MNLSVIKRWVRELKGQALTVWFAARDPQLGLSLRLLALAIAAYAFSPLDLIPDFIPVLGLLDDMLLVPAGLALVIRLAPASVLQSARVKAEQMQARPVSLSAAVVVVLIWFLAALTTLWLLRVP